MKKYVPYIVAIFLCFSLASESWGARRNGNPFYVSAAGALVIPQDSELTSGNGATNTALQAAEAESELSTGLGVNAAIGLFFKRRFRVEFEYAYKSADIDQVNLTLPAGNTVVPSQGDMSINTFMANAAFDFRNSSRISPYLGAGLGVGLVDFQNPTFTTGGVTIPSSTDNDMGFAYQLFGGVNYWINPQVVGFLGYKYMSVSDPTIGMVTPSIDTHNFELGIRYYFSRP
ncbi:MAG: porin family protein [Candidatus Nitronauta litoralis]|uniref:Porin family protein n=1 Tax=Candidatus Nitronauta litoralis TaxID=2705533 RepID=A0A7T0BV26_9BACT|nr:MAG: porin family protein [Candidatus Nitronauta litoralis]